MLLNFISRDAVESSETGRVAFLTPKRIGPATQRNRLRRRMREIYRRTLAATGGDAFLIWIARPPALDLPFDELKKCMAALMQRRG